MRVVRIRIGDVLTGVDPRQQEIEIATGLGDGDCGYPFQTGVSYVIYAYKNTDGQLETGICSRTRPVSEAAEDLKYIHAMSGVAATNELRVLTAYPGTPAKPGATIVAEREGARYTALTDSAGNAKFTGLPPGEYTVHAASDGDLPDDQKIEMYERGTRSLTLFRYLRINGLVTTRDGSPAPRVQVEFRPTQGTFGDGATTGPDGRYSMRIPRPGQYRIGINLNHTPSRYNPYPRWFYPGTDDPALATEIEFTGRPDVRTFNITLPERQAERGLDGDVLQADGTPMARAVVTIVDESRNVIDQGIADAQGRFSLHVFAGIAYRVYAVWPGTKGSDAVSAVPADIQPGIDPVTLRLTLTQSGNTYLDDQRAAARRGQ